MDEFVEIEGPDGELAYVMEYEWLRPLLTLDEEVEKLLGLDFPAGD